MINFIEIFELFNMAVDDGIEDANGKTEFYSYFHYSEYDDYRNEFLGYEITFKDYTDKFVVYLICNGYTFNYDMEELSFCLMNCYNGLHNPFSLE